MWWRSAARIVGAAAGSNSDEVGVPADLEGALGVEAEARAGVVASRSTIRSTVIRPGATPSEYTIVSSVSMPGAPLLIWSNGTPRAASAFSTAIRSGTWSVATRSSVAVGEAGPQRLPVGRRSQRRRDDVARARRRVGSS